MILLYQCNISMIIANHMLYAFHYKLPAYTILHASFYVCDTAFFVAYLICSILSVAYVTFDV